ncbi:MAG: phenylalanine--tRNA ligase subunit alpha [Candidatus Micrarchaeota archaeon]|nr:phenylalanine--tRNA ligase subunit alpha [Candidatus Micrarchaeota archaeon]
MLHQIESKILAYLDKRKSVSQLAAETGLPEDSIFSFGQSLKEKGLVSISVEPKEQLTLTTDAKRFLSEGFPEEKVFAKAKQKASVSDLSEEEKSIGLPWAIKNGWVEVRQQLLFPKAENIGQYSQRVLLQAIAEGKPADASQKQLLLKRKLLEVSVLKTVFLEPTAAKPPQDSSLGQINALSREMLISGSWQKVSLRPYDVDAPVEIPHPASRHIISQLRKKISMIFAQMGFEEMQGPEIQSSFWNFDALFQPQDHPARDLADTFYLKGSQPLPSDEQLIQRVKKVHERYWGGVWKRELACRPVLRTHTTAVSASYLYHHCQNSQPKKYFCIGKVFRNEATDYKHLAEFFQVEGIVVWEGANFRHLLGCLKEFYRRLGFEKIRFQPSYFPYTEPSLEIAVYFEKKEQWIELGGAGIFRPEVSIPLCNRYPVLAWGLSLERPLMLLYDIDDIRDFYKSSIRWLRSRRIYAQD